MVGPNNSVSDSDNAPSQEARWGCESITWSRSPGGHSGTATAITPRTPVSYSTIVSTPGLRKGVALKNVLGSCNDSLQTGTGSRVDLNLDLARPSILANQTHRFKDHSSGSIVSDPYLSPLALTCWTHAVTAIIVLHLKFAVTAVADNRGIQGILDHILHDLWCVAGRHDHGHVDVKPAK